MAADEHAIRERHEIELMWPHPHLFPNSTKHWAVKGRQVKAHRSDAAWRAVAQGVEKLSDEPSRIDIVYKLFPPIKPGRTPDKQNVAAALKAAQDGLADALGVDDGIFNDSYEWAEPRRLGAVIATIEVI